MKTTTLETGFMMVAVSVWEGLLHQKRCTWESQVPALTQGAEEQLSRTIQKCFQGQMVEKGKETARTKINNSANFGVFVRPWYLQFLWFMTVIIKSNHISFLKIKGVVSFLGDKKVMQRMQLFGVCLVLFCFPKQCFWKALISNTSIVVLGQTKGPSNPYSTLAVSDWEQEGLFELRKQACWCHLLSFGKLHVRDCLSQRWPSSYKNSSFLTHLHLHLLKRDL